MNELATLAATQREVLAALGCVLEGDYFFALKSGRVARKYINIDPLLTKPLLLAAAVENMLCVIPSERFKNIETIAAPAVGGIAFAYALSAAFERLTGRRPDVAFAEKSGTEFKFERMGFAQVIRNRKVLVVEDIGSTGGSVKKVVDEVRTLRGRVIETCFLWNRGNLTAAQVGSPTCSLINETITDWSPEDCPDWGEFPLVSDIGHPEYFPNYPGGYISLLK